MKIEQKMERCDFGLLNQTLEKYGNDGFELVSACATPSAGETRYVLFFVKRDAAVVIEGGFTVPTAPAKPKKTTFQQPKPIDKPVG